MNRKNKKKIELIKKLFWIKEVECFGFYKNHRQAYRCDLTTTKDKGRYMIPLNKRDNNGNLLYKYIEPERTCKLCKILSKKYGTGE